jgi:hypothetical protein
MELDHNLLTLLYYSSTDAPLSACAHVFCAATFALTHQHLCHSWRMALLTAAGKGKLTRCSVEHTELCRRDVNETTTDLTYTVRMPLLQLNEDQLTLRTDAQNNRGSTVHDQTQLRMNLKRAGNVCHARLLLLAIIIAVVLSTAVTTLFVCNVANARHLVRLSYLVKLTGTHNSTSASVGPISSRSVGTGPAGPDNGKQQDQPPAAAFKTPAAGSPLPTGKYISQIGQDKYIDDLLHGMTNGFFVESGAHDGTVISNTLFLEANRN